MYAESFSMSDPAEPELYLRTVKVLHTTHYYPAGKVVLHWRHHQDKVTG